MKFSSSFIVRDILHRNDKDCAAKGLFLAKLLIKLKYDSPFRNCLF